MASPFTTSSTRRFLCRPSAVSFPATGCVFPNPRARIARPRRAAPRPPFFRSPCRAALLRHSRCSIPPCLLCRCLRHLLLLQSRRASLLGFLLLPNRILRCLLRFLLHAHRFCLCRFRCCARLVRFLPALHFRFGIGTCLRLAFQRGALFRRHRALRIFLPLLFPLPPRRSFRRLHHFTRRRIHRLLVAAGAINILGAL